MNHVKESWSINNSDKWDLNALNSVEAHVDKNEELPEHTPINRNCIEPNGNRRLEDNQDAKNDTKQSYRYSEEQSKLLSNRTLEIPSSASKGLRSYHSTPDCRNSSVPLNSYSRGGIRNSALKASFKTVSCLSTLPLRVPVSKAEITVEDSEDESEESESDKVDSADNTDELHFQNIPVSEYDNELNVLVIEENEHKEQESLKMNKDDFSFPCPIIENSYELLSKENKYKLSASALSPKTTLSEKSWKSHSDNFKFMSSTPFRSLSNLHVLPSKKDLLLHNKKSDFLNSSLKDKENNCSASSIHATRSLNSRISGLSNKYKFDSESTNKFEKIITVNGKRYGVLSLLGRGGSSEVYQVYDSDLETLLAIKCVNLTEADVATANAFKNEITVLQKLQYSERVIKLHNFEHNTERNCLYVVMERGDTDLATVIRNYTKNEQITEEMTKFYWSEMLRTVLVIHKAGIIHSDLKPANFLLVSGKLKLIDFGIASSLQADMTSVVKDTLMGTFNYMSPEAIQDIGQNTHHDDGMKKSQIKINTKSDVWSLGCILYNLVYGKTPFQHITSPMMKLNAIINPKFDIKFPEIADKLLLDVMKKCLERNPKIRPSIEDLLKHPYLTGTEKSYESASKNHPDDKLSVHSVLQQLAALSPSSLQQVTKEVSKLMKTENIPD